MQHAATSIKIKTTLQLMVCINYNYKKTQITDHGSNVAEKDCGSVILLNSCLAYSWPVLGYLSAYAFICSKDHVTKSSPQ